MKKVDIIFSSHLNSIIGPVQTLKRIISNHSFFLDYGYDLTLFTPDNPKGVQAIDSYQGSPVAKRSQSFFLRKIKVFARFLAQHSFLYDKIRINALICAPKTIVKNYLSQNRNAQIIVFHYIYDCYNYLQQEKELKAKIVLFIHADSAKSTMLYEYFPKARGSVIERQINSITEFVLNKVDKVISISKIGASNFLNEYPILNGRIGIIVNGITDLGDEQKEYVEVKKKDNYSYKYRLISCGTINGRKGQWIVIEALNKLPNNIKTQIEYTIVGDGPQRVSLEEKVKEYGLDNVRFIGSVPNSEVYHYLAEANISILMSSNEGLPLSLIEALRCGLAGISTRVAGIPEIIIDGYNGVLLQPDVEQLFNVLSHIHDYNWDEMGRKSRLLFEEDYTFNRMKTDYLEMLQSL
jgi:glycosyltransferase involved in cell wall biosynthesis